MPEPEWKWYKISESEAGLPWQDNQMCIVKAGDKKLTLARLNGELFAFAWKCPHAGGIMADGFINPMGQVTCPLHRYRFDMKTGRNTSGEGYFLKTYRAQVREDGVWVGWEEKKSWFSF
ncbi:Rieske (2Fe-2S) protein [Sediminibacterium soli]|uniref:Rieske (2Fe-2S) protein n=1 Tax=Sediminibacterium soli TaxID=2698829 RepID=UPI00137B70B2|nr:Rieske 2Fe-2S domain-containing protein [Sediminibacterium soli]NCI48273.1 Rieske 2Fe-2S domain-containing protein [Sediminibacterium soli]